MEEERERLTMATYKEGALIEQVDRALELVVQNLGDVNTTAKPREVVLSIKVIPNRDRTFVELEGKVNAKLAGQETVKTTADLSFDSRGRAVAYNRPKRQTEIPFNVTRIKGGEE